MPRSNPIVARIDKVTESKSKTCRQVPGRMAPTILAPSAAMKFTTTHVDTEAKRAPFSQRKPRQNSREIFTLRFLRDVSK